MLTVDPTLGTGSNDTTLYIDCSTKIVEISPTLVRDPKDRWLGKETDNF